MKLGIRKVKLLGVATVALLALSASGCSSLPSVPDWVDPTTWFGGNDTADNGETPDLASIPDKPGAVSPDEKQQVADQLAADRKNAQYSADALRGGTEPAAAPPPDAPVVAKASAESEAVATKKKVATVPAPAPKAAPTTVDHSIAQDPQGAVQPGALPATAPGAAAGVPPPAEPVQTSALPEAAPAAEKVAEKPVEKPAKKTKVAKLEAPAAAPVAAPAPAPQMTPSAAAPVASASAPVAPRVAVPVATVSPSDAELGFKPSSAPPLDASVSQFVAAPIVDHYRRSATGGYTSIPPTMTVARKPVRRATQVASAAAETPVKTVAAPPKIRRGIGGPEKMTGAVVANLGVLSGAPTATMAAPTSGALAVVYFPGDALRLNGEAKAQVDAAAEQFKASGGQGFVRVVGHSSSRTPNMSPEKHIEIVFKKSQDRANAVAAELIRAGVPAAKVLVEAVGDTQPVYFESMPKGEEGNRRAEIFLQG
ncbi:outer membrane protein OmpA-like peptidoglycan-associated protein [Rhizomicrobium palustre]|uniref:Outer membrane protein OmpA-like peptidoglycan-associated protein n=1 Tax=Rhizomicrobium palustre TaxID=189966 RepID=A0A846N3W3_9PROT|nr:OmpA family protein [Rhizomicrobium palustre]NIK89902.1 outer membrane protein OmpA-like peptidoglycan-associated protein [Rhizomicrobium palustre]